MENVLSQLLLQEDDRVIKSSNAIRGWMAC